MRPDVMANFSETLPSERYLAVMLEGAIQHNLPDSWIETLNHRACSVGARYTFAVVHLHFTSTPSTMYIHHSTS